MRIKTFFITGVIGIAVVTGIYKGLSSPRGGAKDAEKEKEGEPETSEDNQHTVISK
jgi:hypothetical protein